MLAGSGHIAGVVNPPAQMKYQYWTNDALPPTFAEFVEGAVETKGSWWPDWIAWLAPRSGAKVPSACARGRAAEGHRGCAGAVCEGTDLGLESGRCLLARFDTVYGA